MSDIVLGGGGFIGTYLVQALVESGRNVVCIDRTIPDISSTHKFTAVAADLLASSEAELANLFSGAEVVHHLVWSSLPNSAELDPEQDLKDNVGLTVRVLRAARRASARVVFFSSGGTVYGESCSTLIGEEHPRRPVSIYGAAKYAGEVYAELFARQYGLDVRIARVANPYGALQQRGRLQGAVARFIHQAVEGERIEIWGDGSIVRDYLHVSDAVECLIALAHTPLDTLQGNLTFNIGSGEGASLRDVLSLIRHISGKELDVVFLPGRALDVARNVLDINRVNTLLGWRPKLSLAEGIELIMMELRGRMERP